MYINSSGVVLKSTADITTRSIWSFDRPSSCMAMPSDSYIHGCGCPLRNADSISEITSPTRFSFISWRTVAAPRPASGDAG